MKILHESIDGNKLTFPAAKGTFEPNKVYLITDTEILKPIRDELWEIVQEAYKKIGGYKGDTEVKDWFGRVELAKVVLDPEGQIAAIATYSTRLEGNKCFCAARSYKTHSGGTAIRQIIEDDIIDYDGYYWAEVSGGIEKIFKEKGGNPIPNIYASEFLRKDPEELTLSSDGTHYSRPIGQDKDVLTKMIVGFKTKELAKKICAEVANYKEFKIRVNSQKIVEAHFASQSEAVKKRELALSAINQIADLSEEWQCRELLPSWVSVLNESIKILTLVLKDRKSLTTSKETQIKSCLRLAHLFLQDYPKVVVHQFHVKKR